MSDKERMNVESFNLDHRYVDAPFVRLADKKTLDPETTLYKYDIRFTQPNVDHLSGEAVHSVEHLMAELMRNHTDKLIDFSPMGCRTGFYALLNGVEYDDFLPILKASLEDVMQADEVPAANEVQCGWGAYHSLDAAQSAVQSFLDEADNWTQIYSPDAPQNA